ncbi:hypothetical protein B0H13DRAFT_2370007 [Mycena leptocephala]|nr:hypothetical protein B0H13DRAFT_2370007 [Mycena leptocephala]
MSGSPQTSEHIAGAIIIFMLTLKVAPLISFLDSLNPTKRRFTYSTATPEEREQVRIALGNSGRRPRQSAPQNKKTGFRERRSTPLTVTDLYVAGRLPEPQTTPHKFQRCSLCCNVKAHPISYLCGHSHCYACIRLHLETDWTCPVCGQLMTLPPHRHESEQEGLAAMFPVWTSSTSVTYSWEGLTFPK